MPATGQPLKELILSVCNTLKASEVSYREYLAGGKTFRYALELKKYNDRITSSLLSQMQLLPRSLQQDAAALLVHYTAWTKKWEELATERNPGPDDEFVFANEITFPRQAAIHFEEAYAAMGAEIKG